MKDQGQTFNSGHDPEETFVKPLFDEEATEVARPVVPLDNREVAQDVGAYVGTGTAPPVYARAWQRRTNWMVALVVIALTAGTLAGVFGVRLYQKSRAGVATTPSTPEPQPAAAEAPVVTAAEPNESPAEVEAASVDDTPAEAEPEAARAATGAGEEKSETAGGARPAVGRVTAAEGERVGSVHTVEADRPAETRVVEPTRAGVYDTQAPAPEGSEAARRAAREEERLRSAERAVRGEGSVGRRGRPRGERRGTDRVQGIFEGSSESPPR